MVETEIEIEIETEAETKTNAVTAISLGSQVISIRLIYSYSLSDFLDALKLLPLYPSPPLSSKPSLALLFKPSIYPIEVHPFHLRIRDTNITIQTLTTSIESPLTLSQWALWWFHRNSSGNDVSEIRDSRIHR